MDKFFWCTLGYPRTDVEIDIVPMDVWMTATEYRDMFKFPNYQTLLGYHHKAKKIGFEKAFRKENKRVLDNPKLLYECLFTRRRT